MPEHAVPRDRSYAAGDVILCEETAGKHLYIVKRGRVRVVKRARGGETVLGELGPGNLFGEMALIDKRLRSASVIAIEATVCIELPCVLIEDLLARSNPWVSAMLRILVLRLRAANETISGLRERSGDSGEVPVDKITERHLRRIVRKLEDSDAIAWDRMGAGG
ncbi:MAG: cyclic nucleotide-binding domain-containing protein [Planctomycetes bacterium]|nr:cyclic nucleotide-binding domain-containing protein [Planctomycetota bacterium]